MAMQSKLIKFPESLIDEIDAYTAATSPRGERVNFSAALRGLIRAGLDRARLCPDCGSETDSFGALCDACRPDAQSHH